MAQSPVMSGLLAKRGELAGQAEATEGLLAELAQWSRPSDGSH